MNKYINEKTKKYGKFLIIALFSISIAFIYLKFSHFDFNIKNLTLKTALTIIGLALIPTPPSPVPDFGLQFFLSLFIGLSLPSKITNPLHNIFKKIPGIREIVNLTEMGFEKIGIKKDILSALIIGYFITIVIGSSLFITALLF